MTFEAGTPGTRAMSVSAMSVSVTGYTPIACYVETSSSALFDVSPVLKSETNTLYINILRATNTALTTATPAEVTVVYLRDL